MADDFNDKIEAKRKLTGVSAVKGTNVPPPWLRARIRAAAKKLGMVSTGNASMLFQKILLELDEREKAELPLGGSYRRLYDHPGQTTIARQRCFVLEPYGGGASERDCLSTFDYATARLSAVLNCSVVWTKTSWWYPDVTYRIVFSEKQIT